LTELGLCKIHRVLSFWWALPRTWI